MSNITVRRFTASFVGGFARHWLGNDPYRTHLFNALSQSFEQGERLFCRSLRAVPAAQLAPGLLGDVRALVAQEGEHLRMHRQFNEELARQGFVYDRELKWKRWTRYVDTLDLPSRMAITAAFEHFTAGLSHGALYYPEWMGDADEPLRTFWRLHAYEESEHSHVAFDVLRAIGGTYRLRVFRLLQVSAVFAREIGLQTIHNLRRDGELMKWRTLAGATRLWFGRHGMAWLVAVSILRYLSPFFHPSRHVDRERMARWLEQHADSFVPADHQPPRAADAAPPTDRACSADLPPSQ